MALHLIKLCVGVDTPDQLEQIRKRRMAGSDAPPVHVTRQRPRRAAEILDGGSLYWVMKGVVMARSPITALEEAERNGKSACRIVFAPVLIRTEPMLKRPFQGWRYLREEDAPRDLESASGGDDLPPELRRKLMEMGAW